MCEVTAAARTYRLDQFIGFWVVELAGNVQQRNILSGLVLYLQEQLVRFAIDYIYTPIQG